MSDLCPVAVSQDSTEEEYQFVYGDKLDVDIIGALDVLQLAQKFKVHPLTKKCEQLLKTDIPFMDSVEVFETARRYGRRELMVRAGQVMVKSFYKLVRSNALANAEEETLVHILDSDDLSVKEVGLFQFIVDWGRNQIRVPGSADAELLRTKLKNLILRIRYTNMTPEEFTKAVVPTGLLTADENVSVLSYFCGDEATRRDLKIKFNTGCRKMENREMVTRYKAFYDPALYREGSFAAFSKQCMSFKTEQKQVAEKDGSFCLLKKTVIGGITLMWPDINFKYKEYHVLNFNVSIREYSGPVNEGNCKIKFEKKLLSCKHRSRENVPVEPPSELIFGRTYPVIVEDHSTSDLLNSFRNHPEAYITLYTPRGKCSVG